MKERPWVAHILGSQMLILSDFPKELFQEGLTYFHVMVVPFPILVPEILYAQAPGLRAHVPFLSPLG